MIVEEQRQERRITILKPKLTSYQRDMIYADERNTICEATTKAGKTFSHMWWLFEQAHRPPKQGSNYWWVAPIYIQAKIAFIRIRRIIPKDAGYVVNLTDLTITTPVGSVIWFKSADSPDHLFGDDVVAVVMDEASRVKEEAFHAVRTTLTKTKGRMKIIGNVKGTKNWSYQLARKVEAGQVKDWRYFKVTCQDAVEAGILDQEDIDAAEAILPRGVFLELYFGIPFVNSSNKFAYSFDKLKHVRPCSIDYRHPIYLSFDFNRNPICVIAAQIIDGRIKVCHAIKLMNSDIYRLCQFVKNKFTRPGLAPPRFIVNGDASGRASSALVKDNLNYFRIIKAELGLPIQQMKQLASNPRIEENQVLVNAILEHYPVDIDPTEASALIFDLEFGEMLADGSMKKLNKENRNDPAQQLDALDCFRYFLNTNFRGVLKGYLPATRAAHYDEEAPDLRIVPEPGQLRPAIRPGTLADVESLI